MKEKKEGRKNQTVIFHVTSEASQGGILSKGLQMVSAVSRMYQRKGIQALGTSSTKVGVHLGFCQRKFRKCEFHTTYI